MSSVFEKKREEEERKGKTEDDKMLERKRYAKAVSTLRHKAG